ncbi:MAG: prohibitin family protein [Sulfurospirillaceae bacterium]|jgi:regulator of protease activity HflC (stomatin/prohibitin superfamily)|nr:prohibitin family protein [Sulfurospirillaceae bacterium]MCK9545219.1 prohibitin family protein [Sulfurospirillaceae bacterium]NLM99562.1 prohibitin family protein [Campylobacteraceae bacterium]
MPADLNDYFKKRGSSGGGNRQNFEPPMFMKDLGKKAGLIYAIIALIVIIIIAKPFVVINSGEVGIKATMGKFDPTPMQPGFHMFIPFVQKVIVVDTKVRIINYATTEDAGEAIKQGSGIGRKQSISVLDERGLPVSIDITVQYRLNPTNAPQTIASWGLSWEDKIINPVVRDVVRAVAGQYSAEALPTNRNTIAAQIEEGMRSKMESQPNMPAELLTVQLREIILPPKIKEQIERVQVARQEAERAKYEVIRANQEALKKAALAEGTAQAKIIEARGEADAIKIQADANAYANIEIAKSINKQLLELRQIEVQGKFNEALRDNKDAKLFLTPGGAVPNIWVDSKDPKINSSIADQ